MGDSGSTFENTKEESWWKEWKEGNDECDINKAIKCVTGKYGGGLDVGQVHAKDILLRGALGEGGGGCVARGGTWSTRNTLHMLRK